LKYAILTQLDKVPAATKEKLGLLLKKYLWNLYEKAIAPWTVGSDRFLGSLSA
jgi:hypothetical protein